MTMFSHSIPSTREVEARLPYGTGELDSVPRILGKNPTRVRCYVRGCEEILRTPTRGFPGDTCPMHGIRCHLSGQGAATYSYRDMRRNFIVDDELVARRIVGHPFKYESHRLGTEKSEDALTFNVFRSLQRAGWLHRIARRVTGRITADEPRLFLWGLDLTDDSLRPWNLLVDARKRFESHLPIERPLTEPDAALYLPGEYLVLIEAKFTSSNTAYENGPRKNAHALTLDELLSVYHDDTLQIVDLNRARSCTRIYHQLWRNMVFAEWMALADGLGTKAFVVNLIRAGSEQDSCSEFRELLRPESSSRFVRLEWEMIHEEIAFEGPAHLQGLRAYLEQKTAGLKPAFNLRLPGRSGTTSKHIDEAEQV